ncbi:MAG: L-lactate MFS transporter [Clostridium sp.]|uniref:L-lactate MFS transporter n=1 Tax=Clostridium sp. TaxID=1506 RepID=UPI003EE69586
MDKKKLCIIPFSIVMFICLGTVYSWSVFRGPLESLFNIGSTASGVPYTLFLATYAVFMMITGYFIDKYNPKKIMALGTVLVCLGWFLAGFSKNITMVSLTYGVIGGSGVGIIYGVPVAIVSSVFKKKKGLAVGLILSGFGLSPLISAPIAKYLIGSFGILTTFKIIGIAFLVIILPLIIPFEFPKEEKEDKVLEGLGTKEMMKDRRFYGLWICYVIGSLIGLMSVGITSAVGTEMIGLTSGEAAAIVSILAIFNGVGRPIFGYITDKFKVFKAANISYIMIIVAGIMMFNGKQGDKLLFFIAFAIIWMTLGSWLAIAPTATGALFGERNKNKNYGVIFTAYGVGAVLGVTVSGMLRDAFGSYKYVFLFMIIMAVIGMISSLLIRTKKVSS